MAEVNVVEKEVRALLRELHGFLDTGASERFVHYKGGVYYVHGVVIMESGTTPAVAYSTAPDMQEPVWCRPMFFGASAFLQVVEPWMARKDPIWRFRPANPRLHVVIERLLAFKVNFNINDLYIEVNYPEVTR